MDTKVTDWFDGDVKPVHDGYYGRLQNGTVLYWYWRGGVWETGGWTSLDGCARSASKSPYQYLPWRGLASDPKASKP